MVNIDRYRSILTTTTKSILSYKGEKENDTLTPPRAAAATPNIIPYGIQYDQTTMPTTAGLKRQRAHVTGDAAAVVRSRRRGGAQRQGLVDAERRQHDGGGGGQVEVAAAEHPGQHLLSTRVHIQRPALHVRQSHGQPGSRAPAPTSNTSK